MAWKEQALSTRLYNVWYEVAESTSLLRYIQYVGHDQKSNEKLNWLDKLDKINQLLTLWSKRDLSVYGRVQIIKSFAVAQLVQVATSSSSRNSAKIK